MDKTILNTIIRKKDKKSIPFTGLGRCRVCGRLTYITAPPRYLLCTGCKLKGIKID